MGWSDAAAGLAVLAAATSASWVLTGRALVWLRRHAILDRPNDRSSHTVPTPRGGGWGVMLTLLPLWGAIALLDGSIGAPLPVLAGAAALMAVSWMDDRRSLGAAPRLVTQIAAVAVGLAMLPSDSLLLQGLLPAWLDRAVVAVTWLWFVNLFNFMDGIDGLAGSEAATIGIGVAVVAAVAGLPASAGMLGLAAAGSALGFLVWNWHPARLFMGDVGSVPLGYLLGWLLLGLAGAGQWPAALLLPGYFLADASLTLLHRLLQGKKVWQAHREHFYQKSTQRGRTHAETVRAVLVVNAVLLVLAAASVGIGWPAVLPGALAVGLLLVVLARPARSATERSAFGGE